MTNMFFWFGINLFDASKKEYGGFNHFIAYKIFRGKYFYISMEIRKQWEFSKIKSDYEHTHNALNIAFIHIYYLT
jgi:hypothetical protein